MDKSCDLLLINPPLVTETYTPELADFWSVTPPYGLIVVAGSTVKGGYDTVVIDADAEVMTDADLLKRVVDLQPKWVGFTVMTPAVKLVARLSEQIKKNLKDVKIILGGIHPTTLADETFRDIPYADFVVRGEGNDVLVELLAHLDKRQNSLSLNSIQGLSYLDNGNVKNNSTRPPISDLNLLPMPAWYLLPMERYKAYRFFGWTHQPRQPYAALFSSWGCPAKCSFCSSRLMHGKVVRYRSPENVISEIDFLVKNYNVRNLCFEDDCFTAKKSHVFEICSLLQKRGYPLAMMCQSRADFINEGVLVELKKTGFTWISYGVESGAQEILNRVDKKLALEKLIYAIDMTHRLGLRTHLNFIIGLPGENADTIKRTVKFARRLRGDSYGFSFATPFPKTKIWDDVESSGIQLSRDWNRYDWVNHPPQSLNSDISIKQLFAMRRKAVSGVILRIDYVLRIIDHFGWDVFWKYFLKDGLMVFKRFFTKTA
jgi:radical SAM superfamily enzyme YgiQ (UPF0313 family)